ncbi:hypothetical protein MLD38_012394 [Melastoma candidum]|uniref:Uncharacterized protein n=1 Tax=Melastoma candidum TaxID=119954 RepID=A0ACB9REM0_9MYRT|nr:hypothetical protein MLD38_012394 [Melastoma candidum]
MSFSLKILTDKDPVTAIVWFWKTMDRVDSALKDMAVVIKQKDRAEEATRRCCCSKHSRESLDNVLIDLYKKCGKVDGQ